MEIKRIIYVCARTIIYRFVYVLMGVWKSYLPGTGIIYACVCVSVNYRKPRIPALCCCFLHINRSGLNHTQYYTWLPIRYVVCWAERDQRNIYQAPMRAKEKHKHTKNDKEKGTGITKYTGPRKIGEGHSIERVWHSASREPSDTLPGSQPCTQKRVASTTFRTLRVSVFTNGTIDVA